jgi:hypothetical protein
MKNKQFNIINNSENAESFNDILKIGYFDYFLFLPKNTSLNYCKIEDIKTNENYFLFINHVDKIRLDIQSIKNCLENFKIKNAISNYNLKIILAAPHESPDNTIEILKILISIIKKNNWNESQFFIINNNSALSDIKKLLNSNMNFLKMNCLLRIISNNQIKPIPYETDIIFDKKFIFLCLNRKPHNFRIACLAHLKNLKLLENDITNWSSLNPFVTYCKDTDSILFLKKYIQLNDTNLVKNCLELLKEKKLSFYEQNDNSFNTGGEWWAYSKGNKIDTFNNSYINIVTENSFELQQYKIHITEKSFKPFYFFQLPIFLASYQHVKTMREEYNFYLFDDLIDHSYDNEIDDTKRFYMVVNEIKRLSTMREEISIYYKNNIDKLLHNHNFIKEYPEKQIEENYFLNLMNEIK